MNDVALAKEIYEIKNGLRDGEIIADGNGVHIKYPNEPQQQEDVVDLMNGKYILKLTDNGDKFRCNRYGQPWRRLEGDKMVLALFYEVLKLKDEIRNLEAIIAGAPIEE